MLDLGVTLNLVPVIQLATDSIHDEKPLAQTMNESSFLRDFRELTAQHTRGCVIMERPDLLVELAEKHNARDTTVRTEVIDELKKVTPRRSQFQPGDEIPERSFVYRWAKKYAFNDFGTYSKHFDVSRYEDPDVVGSRWSSPVRWLEISIVICRSSQISFTPKPEFLTKSRIVRVYSLL